MGVVLNGGLGLIWASSLSYPKFISSKNNGLKDDDSKKSVQHDNGEIQENGLDSGPNFRINLPVHKGQPGCTKP